MLKNVSKIVLKINVIALKTNALVSKPATYVCLQLTSETNIYP